MKVNELRSYNTFTGQKLRRARKLYRRLVRKSIESSPNINSALDRACARMYESGLLALNTHHRYGKNNLRHARYGMLREWYKMDGSPGYKGSGWHHWYRSRGYVPYRFTHSELKSVI